jgi:ThiF family
MSKCTYSLAMTERLCVEAGAFLLRDDGQEDLCFALWYPSRGNTRTTALLHRLIFPGAGDRRVHGNASFLPCYFERALGEAMAAHAGLAFLHSHLGPGWQSMSDDDVRAEQGHAAAAQGATGLPLVGLTLGTDHAWSARFWEKTAPRTYTRRWCTNVRVVGRPLSVTYADHLAPRPRFKEELRRTVSSWGEDVQAKLARLRIGIVGAGSVGSIVAEAMARTGIQHITLIDFDTVERVNLDRLLHATAEDVAMRRSKVACLARGLRRSATADNFIAHEFEYSVGEEEGFRTALDCDVLFCCVDRPWGRSVLNFIAYAHLIPVVDGGIRVDASRQRRLKRADWKAHIASPDRRCLECLEQYDPGLVAADREGYLDDPAYISGLPEDHLIRRSENVFAFSLSAASFEVLQMLMMVVAPLGIADAGQQTYHFVPGILDKPGFDFCKEGCPYPGLTARGDATGLTVTGRHIHAEKVRAERVAARGSIPWRYRAAESLIKLNDIILRREKRESLVHRR